jgi:Domain of unknown function (DUF1952)
VTEGAPAFDRVLTGIPLWLLRRYLEDLGGRPRGDGRLEGAGWSAEPAQAEDRQVGSLRVGQVRVRLRGEGDAFVAALAAFEKRLVRGGG